MYCENEMGMIPAVRSILYPHPHYYPISYCLLQVIPLKFMNPSTLLILAMNSNTIYKGQKGEGKFLATELP